MIRYSCGHKELLMRCLRYCRALFTFDMGGCRATELGGWEWGSDTLALEGKKSKSRSEEDRQIHEELKKNHLFALIIITYLGSIDENSCLAREKKKYVNYHTHCFLVSY